MEKELTILEKRMRNIKLTIKADELAIKNNDRNLSIITLCIVCFSGLLIVTL